MIPSARPVGSDRSTGRPAILEPETSASVRGYATTAVRWTRHGLPDRNRLPPPAGMPNTKPSTMPMACSSAHRYGYGIDPESFVLAAAAAAAASPAAMQLDRRQGREQVAKGGRDRPVSAHRSPPPLGRGEPGRQRPGCFCGLWPAMAGFPLAMESSRRDRSSWMPAPAAKARTAS